ncbi:hypothetical protein [Streptomyces niveus]|uniref:hypothetical protein n=1 Tax=Streptomyces niveus TaxID=193462 RepID=UPI003445A1A0
MRVIRVVFEAGRARGMGLHDAQLVVHKRYLRYGDSIARTPRSPLDLESLAARAAGLPGRALAARLAVPFHFASPDTPDDDAPPGAPERRRAPPEPTGTRPVQHEPVRAFAGQPAPGSGSLGP